MTWIEFFLSFCVFFDFFPSVKHSKKFKVKPTEWLAISFSGLIKGPVAFIFAGVVTNALNNQITGDESESLGQKLNEQRPLKLVQLVVLISIIVIAPINYIVFKLTVQSSDHEEHKMKYIPYDKSATEWKIDKENPRVFTYADEFRFKPFFIRSYHKRSKMISLLKNEFEMTASLYESGSHPEHEKGGHSGGKGSKSKHNGHH